MKRPVQLVILSAVLIVAAQPVDAQGLHITPSLGAYIPASDLEGVRAGAEQTRVAREGTLGLGLIIEAGWLRGSLAYATGATITDEGVQNRGEIGDGSVLAAAVDFVVRPLPRLLVQPYLLGGVGLKREDYSVDEEGFADPLPEGERKVALHVGIGADLMFGGIGVMAEVTDYVSRNLDDKWGQHDAFAMVGLRIRLGGAR